MIEKRMFKKFLLILCLIGFVLSRALFCDEGSESKASKIPPFLGNKLQVDDKKIEELQKKGFVGPGGKPISKKDFENYNKLCEIWGLDIVYSYCDLSIENL